MGSDHLAWVELMSGMAFSPSDENMVQGKGIVSCSQRRRSNGSPRGTDAAQALAVPG